MKDFEFPTNIKQIGSIGEGLRIYIEDYAYSYLQQYIDTPGYDGKLAFLIGRSMVIDSQTVLFISGIVRGQHTETERGVLTFTGKSFEQARKEIDRYFAGLEIVGWMQSQPGFGLRLSPNTAEYHLKTFPDKSNVCMIMDNDEKINAFYIQADTAEGAKLVETKGFFIYYDKNRPMHEYMLDNKTSKIKVISSEGKGKKLRVVDDSPPDEPPDDNNDEMTSGEVAVQRIRRNYSQRTGKEVDEIVKDARKSASMFSGGQAAKMGTVLGKPGGPSRHWGGPNQRRAVNLLMSFCAILLVVSLVMGVGMVQSIERIDFLEQQVNDLTASHRSLLADFTTAARPVFADAIQSEPFVSQPQESVQAQNPAQQPGAAAAPTTEPEPAAPAQGQNQAPAAPTSGTAQSPVNIEAIISQLQETTAAQPAPAQPEPPLQAAQPPQAAPADPGAMQGDVLLPDVPVEYVVESGDTLSFISRMFYGTTDRMDEIMALNNIDDPDSIRAGDTLRLPRR